MMSLFTVSLILTLTKLEEGFTRRENQKFLNKTRLEGFIGGKFDFMAHFRC